MRRTPRFDLIGLLALLALLANSVLTAWRPSHAHAASVPSGLPSHFGFGLSAPPDNSGIYGWLPNSGIPWDYAYQYLSGGVNTGTGWETWNASGQFALWYAQGAASHGYIPVFPYYELLQSNGSCGSCGEAQKDLSNLNNASTMGSYFANFRLLMQRLSAGTYNGIAGFGKTAIVHVEPDLSGYAEQAVLNGGSCYGFCTGTGNNPALLNAAVASSGDADVAAYPNTYQGFNWALLHLRDRYAPNVLLAFHVSDWTTGIDIGSNSASLDATALGQEAGSFAAQSGITGLPAGLSSYDLLFNDVLDRDAAYYKYVFGDGSRWWDRLNVAFPNFHRWETYVGAASAAAGRSVLVWQVPEGNQYFDTVNNSDGHYQDNRAEYFYGHIAELVGAGVIGVLFGAGNGGSTVHTDAKGDGVTNPASFCTSDGLSSGQICNNHTSTVADDDGGYIRMEGQQYYAGGGYPLGGGSSATPTPTGTATGTGSSATTTPTPPPSATATGTPVPPTSTATAAAQGTPGFSQTTSVSPSSVPVNGTTTIKTTITVTSGTFSDGIVDIEVYDPSWNKVAQQYFDHQNIAAGSSAPYSFTWTAPTTTGTYDVAVGTFNGTWTTNYYWVTQAGLVTVSSGSPSSTASATNTPMPPNATVTRTPVPPTGTNTPLPATSTATDTPLPPTRTNTPIPPTSTATNTPVPPTNTATTTPVPPTSTATRVPSTATATATGTPIATPAVKDTTTVRPATPVRGGSVTINTTITASSGSLSNGVVDLEVYNSVTWVKVGQRFFTGQNLAAGHSAGYAYTWTVPKVAGQYTVMIGVFGPNWTPDYFWDNAAARFSVR